MISMTKYSADDHKNSDTPASRQNLIIIMCACLVCIFGILMAFKLPNALLPPIDRPEIMLYTGWSGKSTQEIEQNLITPLEQSLGRISQLLEQQSRITEDSANIRLKFKPGTDMQQSYIEVLAAVNQVSNWPSEVPRPTILNRASGTNATLATAMMYANNNATKDQIIEAFEHVVKPALIDVEGVASVTPFGNSTEQRIDIEFDSTKLAEYSLSIDKIYNALNNLSDNSGDKLIIGEQEYGLSFKGQLTERELIRLPIHNINNTIIRLEDVASVHKRLITPWNYAAINGKRAFYFRMKPTKGVNALDAVDAIKHTFASLNLKELKQRDITLVLSRDDSKDIKNAIKQVYIALLVGVILAGLVLYYFIRTWKTVVLIFITVPICLAIVMIAMSLSNFSLNVISLAGLALSVGLLLDAAIVLVDAILALKKQGYTTKYAIYRANREVRSAIFSSTLSSIVIFVPILMIDSAESQLFEDLAFTMSSALLASLVVALVVLPAFARYLLSPKKSESLKVKDKNLQGYTLEKKWAQLLCATSRSRTKTIACLIIGLPIAILFIIALKPEIDVLPDPKQRSMISIISFNQPLSIESVEQSIAKPILQRIEAQKLLKTTPKFDVSGMTCSNTSCFLYFNPLKGWHYPGFRKWVEEHVTQGLPGTKIFSRQGSLLSFVMPNSRSSQLEIQGGELAQLQQAGSDILTRLQAQFPDATIRQVTPLINQSANIEFVPNYEQLTYYGLTTQQLQTQLVGLTQGLYLGRSLYQGDSLPYYLKAKPVEDLTQLLDTDIFINNLGVIQLSELAEANLSLSPASLLRVNKQATVALTLLPPTGTAISTFVERVEEEVDAILKQTEFNNLHSQISGSADQLKSFINAFLKMFVFSVLLLMFLLWLSLHSWKLTFAVLLNMPLAMAGGMIFLQLLNLFVGQALDMVTMIGFIILFGLVINNAILLANKFQASMDQGRDQQTAILEAVRCRQRPIYMSTATSIFGMLPLMLLPGEGAEIYRGLAAVIVGGMTFSALFSLSFMAALLSLPIFASQKAARHQEKITQQI